MSTGLFEKAEQRQVLAAIGNRYVLFGSQSKLPVKEAFSAQDIAVPLPRVGDEAQDIEQRLLGSLKIFGIKSADGPTINEADLGADLVLVGPNGRRSLIQIKVRERDTRGADYDRFQQEFVKAHNADDDFELWNFNSEKLHLQMLRFDKSGLQGFVDLHPLDVWEYNADGSSFHRIRIVESIANWQKRIDDLYENVARWAMEMGLETDKSRTVIMSEESMHKFAVPDKELPVLDITSNGHSLASLVPVGLWIIGANGRLNIVTHKATYILIDNSKPFAQPEWLVANVTDRRQLVPFSKGTFSDLMVQA